MAFNPFHAFRKHQKVFFAGLTFICMLTFIFSYGRGDLFDRLLNAMGVRRARGEEVATLYRKEVKEGDVQEVYRQRLLAAGFMTANVNFNHAQLMYTLQQELSKRQKTSPQSIPLAELVHRYIMRSAEIYMNPKGDHSQQHKAAVMDLQAMVRATEDPALDRDPEEKNRFEQVTEALAFQAWATSMPPGTPDKDRMFYFGGSGKTSDLLDFMIWKHQADQMGITLTQADLCRELNRCLAHEVLTPETFGKVAAPYLENNVAMNKAPLSQLIRALTDEVRVAMAKEAVLGNADGVRRWRTEFDLVHYTPAAATPDELLEFFRRERTTVAIDMLPISVENYIPQVKEEPSEEDLQSFYEAHKDTEASADRRVPGFRDPRRIRLAWFSYSPEEKFYKDKAASLAPFAPLLRIGAGANNYAAGGGPLLWAAQVASLATDTRYLAAYESYQAEERRRFRNDIGIGIDLTDRRPFLDRAEVVAGLVGQLLAVQGTGADLRTAPLYLSDMDAFYKQKTLVSFGSACLGGASRTLLPLLTLPLPVTHTTLSLDHAIPYLKQPFEENLARELVQQNILALGKEMDQIKDRDKDPAAVERLLRESEKKYGLQDVHVMKEGRSQAELEEKLGPDLEKLREAYQNSEEIRQDMEMMSQFQVNIPRRPDAPAVFFLGKGVNTPYWGEELASRGANLSPASRARMRERKQIDLSPTYQAFHEKERVWVFWRVADNPAHTPSYEQMHREVVHAWKLEQARVLARNAARRIVAELKERKGTPEDAVKLLRDQKQGKLLELKDVARLLPVNREMGPQGPLGLRRYKPYTLPPDTIPYPPPDLLERLLALKEPGEATVIADRPQKNFYVTVLMERALPSFREYTEVYREPVSPIPGDDPTLWQQMMAEKREAFREKIIQQLRAEAGPVNEDGNLVTSDKVRDRLDSGSDSSE